MARNITQRLSNLNSRRSGADRIARLSANDSLEVLRKSALPESYQKRAASSQPNTRYALGAMQEVSPDYTRISIETAERVGRQLQRGLAGTEHAVDFRLQGSVPLNTHIRGVSDVDLLNIDTTLITYFTAGARARAGLYVCPTTRSSVELLRALRRRSEEILKSAYPAATVDNSGSKAIHLFGGSLARPVDVVPCHWLDTIDYQRTGQEYDRGITILDGSPSGTTDNLPFLHIKRVSDQDARTLGGLKKSIRLCKNVKSDAENEGKNISLSSYDIAAIMCFADDAALRQGAFHELQILAETQRLLDWLHINKTQAAKLIVPDGTRHIFDSEEKFAGLLTLSIEMDDLAREVAREQNLFLGLKEQISLMEARDALAAAYIPAA